MLFMLIVKALKEFDAGQKPTQALMDAMDKYNDDLSNTRIRIMAKGLHPTSEGMRISFLNPSKKPEVSFGPFMEPYQVIGFFLIEVQSHQDAIDWAMKAPDPLGQGLGQYELRQVY